MQIVDLDTTFIHSRSKDEDIEHGVYIDIIPIDACPNGKVQRLSQFFNAVIFSICNIQQKPEYNGGKLTGLMSFGTTLLLGIIRSQEARYRAWTKAEKKMLIPVQEPIVAEPKEFNLKKTLDSRFIAYVHLPQLIFGKASSDSYVVIANGNGMKGAGICDGDYLLMDSRLKVKDGDIVMARVNGEEMCRRIFLESDNRHQRLHHIWHYDRLVPFI